MAENVTIGGIRYDLRITDASATVIPSGSYNEVGIPLANDYQGNVTIPSTVTYKGITYHVTSIGKRAFFGCYGLTSVSIPSTVTSIGLEAFYYCTALQTVGDITNVTEIGEAAFYFCFSLKSITLGDGITSVNEKTFQGCNSLQSVTLGNNISTIGEYAFASCESLPSITLPNTVTDIKARAFAYCYSMGEINLSSNLKTIGQRAFAFCSSLKTITIPSKVTSIGGWAFNGCYDLKEVVAMGEMPASIENSNTFPERKNSILYVPANCKQIYKMVQYWEDFKEIKEMEAVVPEATSVNVTIGNYGVATFCSEYALDFSDVEDMTASVATSYDQEYGYITFTAVGEVPANTGLFLQGKPGTYEIPVIETDATYDNMLVGTVDDIMLSPTQGEYTNFILYADSRSGASFRPLNQTGPLRANRAYLQILTDQVSAATNLLVSSDSESTGIDRLRATDKKSDEWATIDGRRLSNAPTQKGLYIHNGRKVIVR